MHPLVFDPSRHKAERLLRNCMDILPYTFVKNGHTYLHICGVRGGIRVDVHTDLYITYKQGWR